MLDDADGPPPPEATAPGEDKPWWVPLKEPVSWSRGRELPLQQLPPGETRSA